MTSRREFLSAMWVPPVVPALLRERPLIVPVHHVLDGRARWKPGQLREFWSSIWPEAVRDFERCGIRIDSRRTEGEVRRSPASKPVFTGLERGVINCVVTDVVPLAWDKGRGVSAVTTIHHGYHLCLIALNSAHGHQVPLLSVNTCVHELLHVFFADIFASRPKPLNRQALEFRIDLYATRLWLFHDGAAIRAAAEAYLGRLRSERAGSGSRRACCPRGSLSPAADCESAGLSRTRVRLEQHFHLGSSFKPSLLAGRPG